MSKHHRWLVVPALLMTLLAGCTGGGENPTAPVASATPEQPVSAAPAAAPAHGNADAGKQAFNQTCSACHGPDAKGLPHLGKNLTISAFVKSQTDDQLLAFVKRGRAPGEKGNTTGVAMPPKGGNPALTDNQIMDIIAFIRTINH